MIEYVSNVDLPEVADALAEAESVLITTHAKPDGDAIGSAVALGRALERLKKKVEVWVMPPVPRTLAVIAERFELKVVGDDADGWPEWEPDRIVVVDTGSWSQLEAMRDWLEPRWSRATVVDHHLKGDDVAVARFVEPRAAAAAELIARLIDLMGVDYDDLISDALYVGIASDTGWFRFSNTRPYTHELAARLIGHGVDHAELYRRTEQGERPEKLLLLQRALGSMELVGDNVAAIMVLRLSDFEETGALQEETERFVDLPQIVETVQAVALITETEGATRISFRSKPGPHAMDVSALAAEFGGGGHARAAGAKVDAPVEEVVERVRGAFGKAGNQESRKAE